MGVFTDRENLPTDAGLLAVLGESYANWVELKSQLVHQFPELTETWMWNGKAAGWSLKFALKKRSVVYFGIREGWFVAGFVLNERAIQMAMASDLNPAVKVIVDGAPTYPEGRAVRIEVRSPDDFRCVMSLASIKVCA